MKPKKKIVMIGLKGLPARGGAASVGQNIIEKTNTDFDFIVLSVASHVSEKKPQNNVAYKQVVFRAFGKGGLNTFIYYLNCLFYCLRHKFDLVHLHHAESGFITPFLKWRHKVLLTFHGVTKLEDPKFSRWHNKFFRFSEKLNMKYADTLVSVSKLDADYLIEKYNRNVLYIPNSVSINPALLANRVVNDVIVFSAARVYQIKGLHLLLKAMHINTSTTKVLVIGNLGLVEEYQKEIMALAEGLNVEFAGLYTQKEIMLEKISQAKLFVFPSLTEAMSMMLLEVVSIKVPVIASDIPANKAVFEDSEVLFFQSGNAEDLALKIKYAQHNPEEMKNRADNAFKALEKKYSSEKFAENYGNLYRQLIE